MNQLTFWIAFNIFVVLMLVLDLAVFHRKPHAIRFREALGFSIMWVALAAAFAVFVFYWRGRATALEFTTGYLVEESLSVDNLFVFLLIFRYFRVPSQLPAQSLVLGNPGRAFHARRFHPRRRHPHPPLSLDHLRLRRLPHLHRRALFGEQEQEIHPEHNPVLKMFRRWVPVTPDYVGGRFTVRQPGLFATPLLLVLIVVETTDVLFAADSIPAVLAITRDPFIVYTSNVFAILGLRSLYFALAGMMEAFHFLHYGLSAILIFIGVKMLLSSYYPIPTEYALITVGLVLLISVVASLLIAPKDKRPKPR